ncbi:AI-2E family transporter [Tropicimonas sp. IMCC34011]|uniref:AI-2E family transporter n=1 Tax=Tropicimonas sp. IMCC34011 TaxID=2248759 RepID=UPI001E43F09E|nr:AI-2E family transporter [Tropicimonas sp. IMCC34011]
MTAPSPAPESAQEDGSSREAGRMDESTRNRVAPVALIGIFVIAACASLVIARAFFLPVIMGFLLALTFSPVRRGMSRLGVPAGITAGGIVLALLVTLVAAVVGLSAPIRDYIDDAPTILSQVEQKLSVFSEAMRTVSEANERMSNLASSAGGDGAAPDPAAAATAGGAPTAQPQQVVVSDEPGMLARLAMVAPYVLGQAILTLVLLFFLLSVGDLFYEKIVQAVPTFRDKKNAIRIAYDIERKLSRYFFTISIINFGLGVSIALAMWGLGMPNPILFGAVAFIFNFVPYIGAIAGVALATVIGIVALPTVGQALVAGAVYFLLTSFEGQFVTPYAVGRSLKLNPVVVFISVAFWGWAWSVVGMIVAVPTLIALRAFADHVAGMRGIAIFLSGRDDELPKIHQTTTPPADKVYAAAQKEAETDAPALPHVEPDLSNAQKEASAT